MKLPSEDDSNTSADQVRPGIGKFGSSSLDDMPPTSTRFDKPGPASPLAQRPSSPPTAAAAMISTPRPPAPPANPPAVSAPRSGKGGIYQIIRILEKKHGAFFISRLILASGINLRGFDSNTPDDPVTITKFVKSLRTVLSPADMAGLMSQAPSIMNMK